MSNKIELGIYGWETRRCGCGSSALFSCPSFHFQAALRLPKSAVSRPVVAPFAHAHASCLLVGLSRREFTTAAHTLWPLFVTLEDKHTSRSVTVEIEQHEAAFRGRLLHLVSTTVPASHYRGGTTSYNASDAIFPVKFFPDISLLFFTFPPLFCSLRYSFDKILNFLAARLLIDFLRTVLLPRQLTSD